MGHDRAITRLASAMLLLSLSACGLAEEETEVGQRWMAATCGAGVTPQTPYFGPSIEGYASYEGQSTCDPTAKPGTVALRDLVIATYSCTGDSGITRSCSVGGTSEHKEGRAWDWGLNYPHPAADAFLAWLLATDDHGNQHAMARRLGVMYVIWNSKIWKSYQASKGWQTYTGASPHTDHIHISLSWAGANKQTSFWSAGTTPPPDPPPPPDPTPPPPPQNNPPNGWLQNAGCDGITGWAQDPDARDATVDVRIYIDQAAPIVAKANISRPELCTQLGSCHHGYQLTLPVQYRDGKPHTVRVEALDLGTGPAALLQGSPKTFTCSASTPQDPSPQDPSPQDPQSGLTDPDGPALPPSAPGLPQQSGNGEILAGGCAVGGTPPASGLLVGLTLLGLALLRRRCGS